MGEGGKSSGSKFGAGFMGSLRGNLLKIGNQLTGLMTKALGAALQLTKFGLIAGVAASAIAELGAGIAHLFPIVAQLSQVALAASGSLLLIPGALAAGISALAAFKLGTSGVGLALKDLNKGDVAKLNEALKKLAPNAQAFVKEIAKIKPVFDKLRLNVQNTLFANWAKQVHTLGGTLLPTLMAGLTSVAGALNGAISQGLAFFAEKASRLDLTDILGNSARSLGNLGQAFKPLMRIILDVTTVSSKVFADLTGGLSRVLTGWADDITAARASGALASFITDSFGALKQLGGLLLDVGGIIRGVFGAAGAGSGLFSFFDRLNRIVNSQSGQDSLKAIFDALFKAGEALTPVLVLLLQALVPVAQALSKVAIAFAPGLMAVVSGLSAGISSLAPGIAALAPLLTAAAPGLQLLGYAISTFFQGLAPGGVALLGSIVDALNSLTGLSGALGQSLGGVLAAIGPALRPLVEILAALIITLAPGAIALLQNLAAALQPLVDVAPMVGTAVADLVTAIAPLLQVVGPLLAELLGMLADALSGVSVILGPTIQLFAGQFLKAMQQVLPYIAAAGTELLPMLADAGVQLATAFLPLIPLFTQLMEIYGAQLAANLPIVVDLFRQLIPIGVQVGQMLADNMIDMLTMLMPMMPQIIADFALLSQSLLELIVAVAPILPPLVELGTQLATLILMSGGLQLAIFTVTVVVQLITDYFRILAAVARELIAPIETSRKGVETFGVAVQQAIGNAVGVFRNLGSTVLSALSGFGSLLYNAGRSLIEGLINGVQSMLGQLKGLLSFVTNLIPSWKGPLDKDRVLLRPAGVAIMRGFQSGLESQVANVRASLGALTMQIPAMAGAGGAASPAAAPVVHVWADFGDGVRQVVQATIVSNPDMIASATDAGHQSRGFIGTRNRLVRR